MIALVVEATVQQPVIFLMTGVFGDFVEERVNSLPGLFDS